MTVAGSIYALSGGVYCGGSGAPPVTGGGGAIRLVSNSVNVSGGLSAAVVRLEAPLNALIYTGSGTPPVLSTINPAIVPSNPPLLTIVSIAGSPVPS